MDEVDPMNGIPSAPSVPPAVAPLIATDPLDESRLGVEDSSSSSSAVDGAETTPAMPQSSIFDVPIQMSRPSVLDFPIAKPSSFFMGISSTPALVAPVFSPLKEEGDGTGETYSNDNIVGDDNNNSNDDNENEISGSSSDIVPPQNTTGNDDTNGDNVSDDKTPDSNADDVSGESESPELSPDASPPTIPTDASGEVWARRWIAFVIIVFILSTLIDRVNPMEEGRGGVEVEVYNEGWIMDDTRCPDHDGSGEETNLLSIDFDSSSPDACVESCELDPDCDHLTLYRWENSASVHCWLFRPLGNGTAQSFGVLSCTARDLFLSDQIIISYLTGRDHVI